MNFIYGFLRFLVFAGIAIRLNFVYLAMDLEENLFLPFLVLSSFVSKYAFCLSARFLANASLTKDSRRALREIS